MQPMPCQSNDRHGFNGDQPGPSNPASIKNKNFMDNLRNQFKFHDVASVKQGAFKHKHEHVHKYEQEHE